MTITTTANNERDLQRLRRNDARMESVQLEVPTMGRNNVSAHVVSTLVEALEGNTKIQKVDVTFYQLYSSSSSSNSSSGSNSSNDLQQQQQQPPQGIPTLNHKHGRSCPTTTTTPAPSTSSTIDDLFDTIGSLPKLQHISCSGGGMTKYQLPITALTCLLQQASQQLETLQLSRLRLFGTAHEFTQFVQQLQQACSRLQVFSWEDCQLVYDFSSPLTTESTTNTATTTTTNLLRSPALAMDAILKALASLPRLKSIQIMTPKADNNGGGSSVLTLGALEALCGTSSPHPPPRCLERLVLKGFATLNAQHVHAMGPGIATNTTLKTIILPSCSVWTTTTNTTETTATKLDDCLTYMLQDNTCLEHFEMPIIIHNHNNNNESSHHDRLAQIAAKILQKNTNLLSLNLGLPLLCGLATTARTYYSRPQQLTTTSSSSHTEALDSIRFHLKLNQAGRSQLLASDAAAVDVDDDDVATTVTAATAPPIITSKDWVDAIERVSDDLACVYYFVSLNPALYANAALLQQH